VYGADRETGSIPRGSPGGCYPPRMASPRTESPWRPASERPDHPLAQLDGAEVGEGVWLGVELGPRNNVGSTYFRAYLESNELGRTAEPVLMGLQNTGRYPGQNWVEVTHFQGRLPLVDGREVEVPEGIDLQIVQALARLVPPGGHLMMEYDSAARRITAQALAARVPPAATPLGAMMFAAECGVAFRDWYIPEGGREGPRKLQGFRALDEEHRRRRAPEMLAELEAFMERSKDLDWLVQAKTRPLAEAAIEVLRHRVDGG
jgi:hypothetical protein